MYVFESNPKEVIKLLLGIVVSIIIPYVYLNDSREIQRALQQLQNFAYSVLVDLLTFVFILSTRYSSSNMTKIGGFLSAFNNGLSSSSNWPSSFAEPDMALINELMESIESSPPGIEARKLLIEQYLSAGWIEAAKDAAEDILRIDPTQVEVEKFITNQDFSDNSSESSKPARKLTEKGKAMVKPSIKDMIANKMANATPAPKAVLVTDVNAAKKQLSEGYEVLIARAKQLQQDAQLLRDLERQQEKVVRCDKYVSTLEDLAGGKISTILRVKPPHSARAAARLIEATPDRAMEMAITDLDDMIRWQRSPSNPSPAADNDAIREAIAKRVKVVIASLPDRLGPAINDAFMHVEHETLRVRKYINSETMYGDAIPDIPRSSFWVSEDGYAWDMDELAAAIKSGGGIMRNPLSKQLFTTNDIRAIVRHPLGKGLQAMQVAQSKMSEGVRSKTIDELDNLANILLADMSTDQLKSRTALDEFQAYVATLPDAEQKAIDLLKVPAKDSHTGQPFDASIGESVRDALGNRVCFHKTGKTALIIAFAGITAY